MTHPLLTVPVSTLLDAVRVRQLTRQAAALVGFEPLDQITLAAAAFDLAGLALERKGQATVQFLLTDQVFGVNITTESIPPGRLEKPLPAQGRGLDAADVGWTLQQVLAFSAADPLEELQTANRELLRALLELAAQRKKNAAAKSETDAA